MKTIYKVLISFGIGICFLIGGMSLGGLNQINVFSDLNFRWSPDRINNKVFEADREIDDLKIDVHKANIQFYIKDDIETIQIDANQLYSGFEIYQKGDKIVIEQPFYWWYQNYEQANINVYIPRDHALDKVKIHSGVGDVTINNLVADEIKVSHSFGKLTMNDVKSPDINIDASMGKTDLNRVEVLDKIDVDSSFGSVDIRLKGSESEYNYDVDVAFGRAKVGREVFSGIADTKSHGNDGQKKIDVDCSFGSVNIEMED